MNSARAD